MNLPPEPGLNRRLAYSNIIRMRNTRRNSDNRNVNYNFNDIVYLIDLSDLIYMIDLILLIQSDLIFTI